MEGWGNRILSSFCAVASDLSAVCLPILSLMVILEGNMPIRCFAWAGILLIQLLVNEGLISFRVPLNLYLLWNGAAAALGAYLAVFVFTAAHGQRDAALVFASCAAGIAIHAGAASWYHHGPNGILRYVDVLVVETAFYLYTVSFTGTSADTELLTFTLLVLALDLFTVGRLRTREEGGRMIRGSGIGTGIVAAAAVGLCLLASGVVAGIASGQVHSAVDLFLAAASVILGILSAVFHVIGVALGYLILFLLRLLPSSPQQAEGDAVFTMQNVGEEALEKSGVQIPMWVALIFLAVAALALVVCIFYRFRGVRMERTGLRKVRTQVVRNSHFLEAWRMLFRRLREKLRFARLYRRYRKTPEGLFVLAERVGRSLKMNRRAAESPAEYVKRLAGLWKIDADGTAGAGNVIAADATTEASHVTWTDGTAQSPEAALLFELADMLDRMFYAGQSVRLTDREYREYANAVKKTGEKKAKSEKTDANHRLLC
ncbi:MAG: hypothetical protein LUE86_13185 [Clostridiales bacterium]|nr:hypothetical protein [Clostridiales bacterium]